MDAIIKPSNCSSRCKHRLVWVALENGKRTQVRECRTAKWAADNAAAINAFRSAEVSQDLLETALKVLKS